MTALDSLRRPLKVGDTVRHLSDLSYSGLRSPTFTITRITKCFIWDNGCRIAPSKTVYIDDQLQANLQTYPEYYL
jgi:hypothetical protein